MRMLIDGTAKEVRIPERVETVPSPVCEEPKAEKAVETEEVTKAKRSKKKN